MIKARKVDVSFVQVRVITRSPKDGLSLLWIGLLANRKLAVCRLYSLLWNVQGAQATLPTRIRFIAVSYDQRYVAYELGSWDRRGIRSWLIRFTNNARVDSACHKINNLRNK
jgi:hypothetical protein